MRCREAYFNYMAPSGLLQEGTKPVDGVFSHKDSRKYLPPGNLRRLFGLKDDEESEKYLELMISAHEAQFYLDFCANQELRDFISRFTGWEKPHMLQRTMLRAFVPDSELTPVHFDQMYLRAGPPTSLTAWVPIGDVSLEGGGLMYLEGSTDIGQQTEADFARNAQNLTDEERVSAFNKNMSDGGFLSRDTVAYGKERRRRWLIAEYEAGDVIFHNPWMVHASCKNKDPNSKIRLATDLRFVDPEKPYDQVSTHLIVDLRPVLTLSLAVDEGVSPFGWLVNMSSKIACKVILYYIRSDPLLINLLFNLPELNHRCP